MPRRYQLCQTLSEDSARQNRGRITAESRETRPNWSEPEPPRRSKGAVAPFLASVAHPHRETMAAPLPDRRRVVGPAETFAPIVELPATGAAAAAAAAPPPLLNGQGVRADGRRADAMRPLCTLLVLPDVPRRARALADCALPRQRCRDRPRQS